MSAFSRAVFNSAYIVAAIELIERHGGQDWLMSVVETRAQQRAAVTVWSVMNILRLEIGDEYKKTPEYFDVPEVIREIVHNDPLQVLKGAITSMTDDNSGYINRNAFRLDWCDFQGRYFMMISPLDLVCFLLDQKHPMKILQNSLK